MEACYACRRLLIVFVLLSNVVPSIALLGADCNLEIDRRLLRGIDPKVIPAPDANGLAVVYQDSEDILLKRFDRKCQPLGKPVLVNSTEDFWRAPGQSGLADAVGLDNDSTIVAWVLGGDVWVRLVQAKDSTVKLSPVLRVNGDDRYDRADVRIVANPARDGFIVSWNSWMQDGDGWGVFAKPFSISWSDMHISPRAHKETRVNQAWQHFQWHSQLQWCGSSLWALWENASDGACGRNGGFGENLAECSTGPYLRRLAACPSETWGKTKENEERMHRGEGPLAAALTCLNDQSDDALVLWIYKDGLHVGVNRSHIPTLSTGCSHKSESQGQAFEDPRIQSRRLSESSWSSYLLSSLSHVVSKFLSPFSRGSLQAPDSIIEEATEIDLSHAASFLGVGGASDDIGNGQVNVIANRGLLLVLTNTEQGVLSAQLLQLLDESKGVRYPRRQIASGAQHGRAVWDVSSTRLDLVTCWAQGGLTESIPAKFVCGRRWAQWLVDDGLAESGGKLGLFVMFSFISVFCLVKHCNQPGRRGFGRGGFSDERGRQRRTASQARLRDLRRQLSEIPDAVEPPTESPVATRAAASPSPGSHANSSPPRVAVSTASLEVDQGSDSSAQHDTRWTPASSMTNECSICQNEVTVRVALRPCGHTACKKCISRIVEMNQPSSCPFCRSAIDGVQTVYL